MAAEAMKVVAEATEGSGGNETSHCILNTRDWIQRADDHQIGINTKRVENIDHLICKNRPSVSPRSISCHFGPVVKSLHRRAKKIWTSWAIDRVAA